MVQQIQQPIESYAPYAQGQTLVNSANFIETTANWCSCLQGQKPILRILDELANAMGAGLVLLSRVPKDPNMPSRALSSETRPDNYGSASARSFARNIMGGYLTGAKPGSVWVQSVVAPDHDEDLARFQRMRQFHELALIPLQSTDKHGDFLEFHFPRATSSNAFAHLNMIAPTLAATWQTRAAGTFTDSLLRHSKPKRNDGHQPMALSFENPCKFSRAEYRICVMFSRGLDSAAIREELGISQSTLSTHLGNIYAKTGCTGQRELVFFLMSGNEPVRSASHMERAYCA